MNKLNIILGIVLLGAAFNLTAQQSINASGGEATGVGHASYSVGQITYEAIESVIDDASVFQGVQIPFEAYEVGSCATDFNGDGTTNGLDFVIFLGNFDVTCALPPCPTDINGDDDTNGLDFIIFLGNFDVTCN